MTVANNEKMLKALLSTKNPSSSFIAKITINEQSFREGQLISVKSPYDNKIHIGKIDSIVYLKSKSTDNKHLYFLVEIPRPDVPFPTITKHPVIFTDFVVVHVNTYLEYCKRHNLKIYGETSRNTKRISVE